jgi:hypothetical protein
MWALLPSAIVAAFGVASRESPFAEASGILRRKLQSSTEQVSNTTGLLAALSNVAIERIVLAPGPYDFDSDATCTWQGIPVAVALCITRPITIEAEVSGTVVLNAYGASAVGPNGRGVMFIDGSADPESPVRIVGLNITGGHQAGIVSDAPSPLQPKPAALRTSQDPSPSSRDLSSRPPSILMPCATLTTITTHGARVKGGSMCLPRRIACARVAP